MLKPQSNIELTIQGIRWLARRSWGLAFLLSFGTLMVMGLSAPHFEIAEMILEDNPIARAGWGAGTLIFPDPMVNGGRYWLPLFPFAANLMALAVLWFVLLRMWRNWRSERPGL